MLLVGESSGTPIEYRVPRDFLRRRSREFRTLLHIHGQDSEPIKVPDTRVSTFEDFIIWTFRDQPKIKNGATFDEVVQLGIFAWRYQIASLSNQVTDVIRRKVSSCDWPLQASILDDIYEAVPSKCPLREVVRAALGQLPRPDAEGEVLKDDWKATFLKHAELGWDYIQACATEWAKKDYLTDACRFHDHQDVSHRGPFAYCDGCPFSDEDCYPEEPQEQPVPVNGFRMLETEDDEVANEVARTEDAISSNGTTVTKVEEPVEVERTVNGIHGPQKQISTLNGNISKDAHSKSGNDGTETPIEASVNGTEQHEAAMDDDVEETTVHSDGLGDEPSSIKENESVIEEVDEKLEEKLDELKIEDTKVIGTADDKITPEPKPKKKKPKKRGSKA